MLSLDDFLIAVYCLLDDVLHAAGLRRARWAPRGPRARLAATDVLTMEVVGEFLGLDTDKAIWAYFRRHWQAWFPGLGSREAFARQAANLWAVKQVAHHVLAAWLGAFVATDHLIDTAPAPVCRRGRMRRCKRLREHAALGWCDAKKEWYFGLKLHLVVTASGVITALDATPANVDERPVVPELVAGLRGRLLGDLGYLQRALKEALAADGLRLMTPHQKQQRPEFGPRTLGAMKRCRRWIETVFAQLVERFHIARIWARDRWHLTSRLGRKVLAHTVATALARQHGLAPLDFDGLVAV